MAKNQSYLLLEYFGIELEYMIVDKDTLEVKNIADKLLADVNDGIVQSDFENGNVTWSNELAAHVVELKSTTPDMAIFKYSKPFAENIRKINRILSEFNCKLMGTAMHPFMNPQSDSDLWAHEDHEIYQAYNKIFNCKSHGWTNLQSTHLNISFSGDHEFSQLHCAIRLILPLLPAISASSPVMDGIYTGFADNRLEVYQNNQHIIPSIAGDIIPEDIHTEFEYNELILKKIKNDIYPYDKEGILNPYFLNSRGAIARFDRGSIEIRLLDVQEAPIADLAILELIVATIKMAVAGKLIDTSIKIDSKKLKKILFDAAKDAENAMIIDQEYLALFNISEKSYKAGELWRHIFNTVRKEGNVYLSEGSEEILDKILKRGTLSTVIIQKLGKDFSKDQLIAIYNDLSNSLEKNQIFS